MRILRSLVATAAGFGLTLGTVASIAVAQAPSATADQARDTAFPALAAEPFRPVTTGVVEPAALDALKRMSTYLSTLKAFELTSEGSLDVVTEEGQRVQLDGVTRYKVRRPGFVIDYASDLKNRRFIYDGKQFTVHSPRLGFYATVPAPRTNREVLEIIYNKYGIKLPLEDLFRWNDPKFARAENLKSGYPIGTATLNGVTTDHYAFREPEVDWEVWIERGQRPLPRKLVIVDRTDPAHPTFIARLNWNVNPSLSDRDFAFTPGQGDKRIQLATYEGSGE